MKVETPEVGKTYWTVNGCRWDIVAVDDHGYFAIQKHHRDGRLLSVQKIGLGVLYDTDPTKPEPLPALDISKPVKRRDGLPIRNVRLSDDGKRITYEVVGLENPSNWYGQVVELHGLAADSIEHRSDLLQCTRRDWTAADVPRPWASLAFRQVSRHDKDEQCSIGSLRGNGLRMCNVGLIEWDSLARDWECTVDGKTWLKPEAWE